MNRRHWNIFGDETTNADEFIYCTHCKREIDMYSGFEEFECRHCGKSLMEAEDIITGAMLKREREKVDRDLEEWTRLNLEAKRLRGET